MPGTRALQPRSLTPTAPTLLAALCLLSTAAVPAASQTHPLTCISHQQMQSTPLRSSAGFTVILKMQSDDDHEKNTHLCRTDYTLAITHPDGTSQQPVDIFGADDTWNRPLRFRTEGFSHDGKRAFFFISESPHHHAWIEAVEYDLAFGTSKDVSLKPPPHLSPACAATLHIAGTDPTGFMVLAIVAKDGCTQQKMWRLKPNNANGTGGVVRPESPEHLPSQTTITPLLPGSQHHP